MINKLNKNKERENEEIVYLDITNDQIIIKSKKEVEKQWEKK